MSKISKIDINHDYSDEDISNNDNPMVASFAEDVDLDDLTHDLEHTNVQEDNDDIFTSDDEKNTDKKISGAKQNNLAPKLKLKPKLSNSSAKSEDGSLHFDLPEHLKVSTNLEINQVNDDSISQEECDMNNTSANKKKPKKSKKSKEKKHKKQKSMDKERDELEEFLNGIPPSNIQPEEGTYEEL